MSESLQASLYSRRKRTRERRAYLQNLMTEVNATLQLKRVGKVKEVPTPVLQNGMREALDGPPWSTAPFRESWFTRMVTSLKRMIG